jgi:hypothetical protein
VTRLSVLAAVPVGLAGIAGAAAVAAQHSAAPQAAAADETGEQAATPLAATAMTSIAMPAVVPGALRAATAERAEPDLSARAATATSRSVSRAARVSAAAARPEARVLGNRWATVALNVRVDHDGNARVIHVLEARDRIRVTDRTKGSWRMVRFEGEDRWVRAEYLARQRPRPEQTAPVGLSTAPCPTGSAVEAGLVPNAVAVHRAVCARFPQVTAYGGYRAEAGSYHATGQAVDVMVSGPLGDEIAAWLQANAGSLGVSELIWEQQIWTVQRASEGWRWMPDAGSPTANHFDHVHVSVF